MAFALAAPGAVGGSRVRVSTCRTRPVAASRNRATINMGEKDKYATVGDQAQAVRDAEEDGTVRGAPPTSPGSTKDMEGNTNIFATTQLPMRVAVDQPTDIGKVVSALFVALVLGFAVLAIIPFNKEAEIALQQGEAPASELGLPSK